MLFNINFKYGYKPTAEEFARIKAIIPDAEIETDEFNQDCVKYQRTHVVDLTKLVTITTQFELQEQPMSHTMELAHQVEQMAERISDFAQERQFNNAVNVHVPNFALLNIRESFVLVDCCTEVLNDNLGEGWRILAICPQPNQRRPDYVMGK